MSEEITAAVGTRGEFMVALTGRALAGQAQAKAPRADTQPAEEVPRVARLLALAHRWQRLIDEGRVRDQAEIARLMGVSRARVTQIMRLQWLAPAIQEGLLTGSTALGSPAACSERSLSSLTAAQTWGAQQSHLSRDRC